MKNFLEYLQGILFLIFSFFLLNFFYTPFEIVVCAILIIITSQIIINRIFINYKLSLYTIYFKQEIDNAFNKDGEDAKNIPVFSEEFIKATTNTSLKKCEFVEAKEIAKSEVYKTFFYNIATLVALFYIIKEII